MTIYTLQQTNFYICSFTQFTVVDCGDPPRLESGTLATPANTTYGSTIGYVCNEDYVFSEVSSESHICLASGLWSDEDIKCRKRKSLLYYVLFSLCIIIIIIILIFSPNQHVLWCSGVF